MAKKILLIEYEPRYLDRIRGYLVGRDFDVVVAKDGDEGLEAYRRSRPDLVLISSVLPKLRTPDVIKGMQSLGAPPPILLMMSGYRGKNRRADAGRVGATSILVKPFSEDEFLAEVETALGQRPAPAADASAPLLSSDDIFSDVLSGMDETPPPVPARVSGTDPAIQKKLEQTLSGILPAPRKTTGTITRTGIPNSRAPEEPAEKGAEPTVRLDISSVTSAPAAPARPPVKIDSSVDRMLTQTLSGLKSGKSATEKSGIASRPMDLGLSAYERPKAPAPEPKPVPKPESPSPTPAPAAAPTPAPVAAIKPVRPEEKKRETGPSVPGGFGRYALLEKIAAGGMAEVYKARMRGEEGFEKIVAIKRILPHMADNDDFITMFIDEAKLAAQLTHNNIIHIYDLGKVDAYHYIAMEYVEGKDLRSILRLGQERGHPLPPELALFVASKIANALDYAHRRVGMDGKELDLVHRDVSPQNILISFEGDIKLCDFGIAKAATKVSQTQAGALKGKLQYMSPEQAWGKKIDRRTDIFSLGIVLFEMLTGDRLFAGDTDLTILEQVRDARVVVPSSKNAEVPKRVDQIVLRALAKSPQDRYQNASELEKEINAVLYSFQPTPGPADLAIYMHRLVEAASAASDARIDAAFASAEAGPVAPPARKGKGLVISKKAPGEKTATDVRVPAAAPAPPAEVSQPSLPMPAEAGKSRTGLYAAIGVAAVALIAGGIWVVKGKGSTAPAPMVSAPPPAAAPETVAVTPSAPAPQTTAASATPAEPVKVLDQKAVDAEARRLLAEKEKQLREAAAKQQIASEPVKAPPASAPSGLSLAPRQLLQPPKPAEAPKPTEVPPQPRPPEPVKVAEAAPVKPAPAVELPKPAEASAPAPPPDVPPPSNAPVREGDLVGPGEGVVEPKLVKIGSYTLPPQAKQVARGTNQALGTPVVMALVTENGIVAETRLLRPSAYKFVDEAAVAAIKASKIDPATKNGVKVKMWKTFAVPIRP